MQYMALCALKAGSEVRGCGPGRLLHRLRHGEKVPLHGGKSPVRQGAHAAYSARDGGALRRGRGLEARQVRNLSAQGGRRAQNGPGHGAPGLLSGGQRLDAVKIQPLPRQGEAAGPACEPRELGDIDPIRLPGLGRGSLFHLRLRLSRAGGEQYQNRKSSGQKARTAAVPGHFQHPRLRFPYR